MTRRIPKFNPDNEKLYYLEKCAGGPYSNYRHPISNIKSIKKAVIVIQKHYRHWKAKKKVRKIKSEIEEENRLKEQKK